MFLICSAGFVDVVMGAHNIRENEDTQVTMTSTDFFTHENWNSFLLTNDLALIRLPNAVEFTGLYASTHLRYN